MEIGQVLSASVDDHAVDVYQNNFFDAWIAKHFSQRQTIAAALNQNTPGSRMVKKRG